MKSIIITIIALLSFSVAAQAQDSIACQPDSAVMYLVPSPNYPEDTIQYLKFSYDSQGLLEHFKKESVSEEQWNFMECDYQYDENHNLTVVNIIADSYDAWNRSKFKELYAYLPNNQKASYAYYYYNSHNMPPDFWECRDSTSYQYDSQGRLTETTFYYHDKLSKKNYYEYDGNKTIITTEGYSNNTWGDWIPLCQVTRSFTDDGKLSSCLRETYGKEIILTSFLYDGTGNLCNITIQKEQDGEFANLKRIVFEQNQAGFPSVIYFEDWDNGWQEGVSPNSTDSFGKDYFIYAEKHLSSQNKLLCVNNTKRIEIFYSNTPMPDYDVFENTESLGSCPIFPNPTSGLLIIKDDGLMAVKVYNSAGQEVKVNFLHGEDLFTIDVSSLPSGLYFVSVTGQDGKMSVQKVMKE